MFVKSIELKNYRNYQYLKANFDKNSVLLAGDNGQGKTNFLESIYYLSTGKSHRTFNQDDLIKWGADFALLRTEIFSEEDNAGKLLEIEIRNKNMIKIKIGGIYYKKKSDFINMLPSVMFSPDDLRIIKSGPAERRNFMDSILEKIDGKYPDQLLKYQKILNQRNSLIKSLNENSKSRGLETIEAWNENLVKYGTELIIKRIKLISEITGTFKKTMNIFFKDLNFSLQYIYSWDRSRNMNSAGTLSCGESSSDTPVENDLRECFLEKLRDNFQKDFFQNTTTIGPHRDDLLILFGDNDLRSFGSQGQQRAAAICLRMCELRILRDARGTNPVLLLDDVLSELDLKRRKALVGMLKDGFQTFVTATNMSYLNNLDIDFGSKFLIRDHKIDLMNY